MWLSNESLLLGSDYKGVSISASSDIWGTPLTGRSLFTGQSGIYFVSALNTVYSGSLSDSSNHWQIQFTVHYSDQTFDSLASSTNQNVGASTWVKLKNSINSAKSTLTKTADFVYVTATKVGNPSPLFVKSGLEFKWVHP